MVVDMYRHKRRREAAIDFVQQFQPVHVELEHKVTACKYKDLLKLLNYVPPIHHQFYTSLPHESEESSPTSPEHPDIYNSDTEEAYEESEPQTGDASSGVDNNA